jgi:alkylated DNA nucleotide flippase Atl1
MPTGSIDPKRQSILAVVRSIAYGEVRGYAEVARAAGLPRHARFVARVLAEAVEPALPWHRVLRSDGRIAFEPDSKAAEDFLKKVPVSFPIAFDPDSRVSKLYSVQGMPSSIIIDRKGNARVIHRGYKPGDENVYLDHIRKLFKE